MTTIRYFVPEDGDTESFPNVFLAPKPRQPGYPPTLGEIKNAFPLPGRYHFRFKSPLVAGSDRDKSALAVWLDCVDDLQTVPTWKSTIVAKVTRIGVDDDEDDDDENEGYPRSTAPSSASVTAPAPVPPVHQHSHCQSNGSVASLDIFDGPVHSMQSQLSISAPPSTGSLLDSHITSAPLPTKESSLLDMSAPAYSTQASPTPHADFFGMTANTGGTTSTNQVHAQQPQQAPMSGGYPPQQQRQGQYGAPSSQQQQQFPGNVNNYSKQNGPFGDLGTPWK